MHLVQSSRNIRSTGGEQNVPSLFWSSVLILSIPSRCIDFISGSVSQLITTIMEPFGGISEQALFPHIKMYLKCWKIEYSFANLKRKWREQEARRVVSLHRKLMEKHTYVRNDVGTSEIRDTVFYLNYTKALQDNVLCNSYSFRHYFIFNFLDKNHDSYPQSQFSV